MKISEKDIKLLLVLLIIGIVVGAYKLNGMFSDALKENEQVLDERNARYTDLLAKSARRKEYMDDTLKFQTEHKDLLASYKTSISQEQSLVFLGMVEKATGVWLKQVGFSDVSTVYTFGNVKSSNPGKSGNKVYSTDYKGITTSMTLSYECTYADLKRVLKYLEEYGKKATVRNISFSYSQATDIVNGTMQMSLYSITGKDRPKEEVNINDVAVGTDNIFTSDTFIASGIDNEYRDKIINDYDLYLIMNQVGSDSCNMAIGMANDPMNEATVISDSTGVEEVSIIVTGSGGEYRVSYKIGSNIYPAENYAEGAVLVCGDTLDMVMISKPRAHKDDNTIANVSIVNNTDMALNIAVINDDEETPRINIVSQSGTVKFYE